MRFPWSRHPKRASSSARARALQGAQLEGFTPLKSMPTLIAGGRQTKGALPVRTGRFSGALVSSRGRGYARYNEDAAGLFSDARGDFYAAAFDQAGGLGGRVRGQASQIAAHAMTASFRNLVEEHDTEVLSRGMQTAMRSAHTTLVERAQGEVTTAVAAITRGRQLIVVNSGDSAALKFNKEGVYLTRTKMHEQDTIFGTPRLTHALGLGEATTDSYLWTLEKGDWVFLGSDGFLDSGIGQDECRECIQSERSPENLVNRLSTLILQRMARATAKPDNLTLIAFQAL